MQSSSRLMGPRLFPLPRLSITQSSSSSPTPSSLRAEDVWTSPADHASGLDTKCRGQLFGSLGGEGGVKMLCSWKEPKIPEILQNLVLLLYRLWTEDVIIMVDAVTHSHMDSRGPRTCANACICCTIPLAGGGSSRSSWAPSSVKLKTCSCVIVTLLSSPEGLRHAPPPAVFTHAAQSERGEESNQS